MDLGQLLAALPTTLGARLVDDPAGASSAPGAAGTRAGATKITGVTHDTRAVTPGALFCCVRGQRTNGHDLAAAALDAGAAALLVDHPLTLPAPHAGAPQVQVPDVRAALGRVSAAFWGRPSEHMYVVGVTGTAGKTTVTHLVQAVLDVAGLPCGLIGTISGARTTPEAPELQALLAKEAAAGRKAVAVEVSSHGLELHRVDATRFAVAVFTNLSPRAPRLPPHDGRLLRSQGPPVHAGLHRAGRRCAPTTPGAAASPATWRRRPAPRGSPPTASTRCPSLRQRPGGSSFTWRGERVELRLPGRFNVLNALAAAPRRPRARRPRRHRGQGPVARRRRCRAASSRSTPASPSPCSSTTPTSPRPSSQALATARELVTGEGRVRRGVRLRGRPRRRQAAGHGRGRGPAGRRRGRHVRQSALRGPTCHHLRRPGRHALRCPGRHRARPPPCHRAAFSTVRGRATWS